MTVLSTNSNLILMNDYDKVTFSGKRFLLVFGISVKVFTGMSTDTIPNVVVHSIQARMNIFFKVMGVESKILTHKKAYLYSP